MDDFEIGRSAVRVEPGWMAEESVVSLKNVVQNRIKRFNKRVQQLAPYVVQVRARRSEVRLRIKTHPNDTVGQLTWVNILTRESLIHDPKFIDKLLPK